MRRRHTWFARTVLVLGLASWPAALSAQSAPASAPTAASGTLAALAAAVGEKVELDAPAWVVVGPVEVAAGEALSPAASKALHERIRLVVGSAISPAQARSAQALSLVDARRQARLSGRTLVHLAPRLGAGALALDVDVVTFPRAFWQRARFPEGLVRSHLSLSMPADAEIRRLLPRGRGLFTERRAFPSPLADVIALGCGQDDRGGVSLVVVGRRTLVLGRFRDSAFVVERQAEWSSVSPLAPTPLRAPLAGVVFGPTGIDVGSSDRARLIRFDHALIAIAHGPRAFPLAPGRCAPFSASGIGERESNCGFVPVASPAPRSAAPLDEPASSAWRQSASFSDFQGISTGFDVRVLADGSGATFDARSPLRKDARLTLADVGSAVALADLDGDGHIEVVHSTAVRDAARDQVRVETFDGSALSLRAQHEVPGVRAIAICPFSGTNPLTLVVAGEGQLWVLS